MAYLYSKQLQVVTSTFILLFRVCKYRFSQFVLNIYPCTNVLLAKCSGKRCRPSYTYYVIVMSTLQSHYDGLLLKSHDDRLILCMPFSTLRIKKVATYWQKEGFEDYFHNMKGFINKSHVLKIPNMSVWRYLSFSNQRNFIREPVSFNKLFNIQYYVIQSILLRT